MKGSDGKIYLIHEGTCSIKGCEAWYACTTYDNGRLKKLHSIPFFTRESACDFLSEYARKHNIQLSE